MYAHECPRSLTSTYQHSQMSRCLAGRREPPVRSIERKSLTLVPYDVGSGASWIELDMELEDDLLASRGDRAADGETGLAAPEPGRLWVRSMGFKVFWLSWLLWLSTESVDEDERERRMYGRGGGFFGSWGWGTGCSRGSGTSAPYSSTIRGGGRSTIASSSCIRLQTMSTQRRLVDQTNGPLSGALLHHIRFPSLPSLEAPHLF